MISISEIEVNIMKRNVLLILSLFAGLYLCAQPQSDLSDSLRVEADRLYAVHWAATFSPVVSTGSSTMEVLEPMIMAMRLVEPDGALMPHSLLCEHQNSSEEDVARVCDFISSTPLPRPYEWFWGINDRTTLVFGIKNTADAFTASVAEASVFIEPAFGDMPVVAFSLDNGEKTEVTKAFEDFTARNIGKAIATEINGVFIMAPMLNSSIEGGSIEAVNLPVSVINALFDMLTPQTMTEEVK